MIFETLIPSSQGVNDVRNTWPVLLSLDARGHMQDVLYGSQHGMLQGTRPYTL